jgi:hypothetical protein
MPADFTLILPVRPDNRLPIRQPARPTAYIPWHRVTSEVGDWNVAEGVERGVRSGCALIHGPPGRGSLLDISPAPEYYPIDQFKGGFDELPPVEQ